MNYLTRNTKLSRLYSKNVLGLSKELQKRRDPELNQEVEMRPLAQEDYFRH